MRALFCVAPAVLVAVAWGCGADGAIAVGGGTSGAHGDAGDVRVPDGATLDGGDDDERAFDGPVTEPDAFAAAMLRQLRVGKMDVGNGAVFVMDPKGGKVGLALGPGMATEYGDAAGAEQLRG